MLNEQANLKALMKEVQLVKVDLINWGKDSINTHKRNEAIKEAVSGFNPDTHVIVSKDQLDVTIQLQALTGIAKQVDELQTKQDKIITDITNTKAGVDFIVSRFTKSDKPETKLKESEAEKIIRRKSVWLTVR